MSHKIFFYDVCCLQGVSQKEKNDDNNADSSTAVFHRARAVFVLGGHRLRVQHDDQCCVW